MAGILKKGDEIRIIAPSRSLSLPWISKEIQNIALDRFKKMGLNVTFGENVKKINEYCSSSIKSRVDDIHNAFNDKQVKAILTVTGGYNSIEILPYLDYNLIREKSKIFCGYSDITVLLNAIYKKTNLVTYYSPHFFDFGEINNFNYSLEYFKKCLFSDNPYKILPSQKWSDDRWGMNQSNRHLFKNNGGVVINEGEIKGTIIGGNLCSFQLLLGTDYLPSFKNSILFIEDISKFSLSWFNRNLNSLILNKESDGIKGMVIGRFQKESDIHINALKKIIKQNKHLENIPIVANIDFGHTTPKATFPIGGLCQLTAIKNKIEINILKH